MAFTYDDAAKNLLVGKDCEHCLNHYDCRHPQLRKKFSTCYHWKEAIFGPEGMLRIVRLAYPNVVKGDLIKEMASMKKQDDSIFYLKPIFKEENDKK